jgi:prevent-host-death family protein
MSKQYSIAAARNQLPAIVHEVENGPPVELTRRGKPVAVLVSARDYERLKPKKPSLWEAIQQFRDTTDLSDMTDIDEIFADVRDRSPGRDVDL